MKFAAAAVALLAIVPVSARAAENGARLYAIQCSSCHGLHGEGSRIAPPLIGMRAAGVHFMLDTGRMPAPSSGVNEIARAPRLTRAQIDAVVRHVLTFSSASSNASLPRVTSGNVNRGRTLFAGNCAQCHGAVGDGASVGADDVAPSLATATALQIAEAVRSGPGVMPRFGSQALGDADVDDIASYLSAVRSRSSRTAGADAGGLPLAHAGPVAEGFVLWIFGLGALVLFIRGVGAAGDRL